MAIETTTGKRASSKAMFDKIWDRHVIVARDEGPSLIYIDRDIIHEGSFHAFADMKRRGLKVRRPRQMFGTPDHYVPTSGRTIARCGDAGDRPDDQPVRRKHALGRHPQFRIARSAPGHCPCDRARTGHHAAGPDHRVQRQPHVDPWRAGRHRVRHRAVRERACDGNADLVAGASQDHAHHHQWQACRRGSRQGRDPCHHRRRSARAALAAMPSSMRGR